MKHTFKYFACLFVAILCFGQVWADTKTEGFETKAAGTTYNSTVTVSASESDCGIGWTIYYGTVSTNDKISGSKSAQMRYYSSSDNRGYVQSTTPIDGLSHVAFKARVSSTNIKMTVSYSADASSWTALATNETFSETGKGIAFNYDVPSGGKYIKIEIGDGSTKPSSGNIKFIIDDVEFTYTSAACETPSFSPAAGSYEGTQNVTISSTAGATIYYTTDGSDPKTSGTKQTYSSAIPVAADMTIKAYATLTSYDDSEVATAAYTITEGPDVTLDLIDGNWGFPTSNATGTETYTNSVTGYSVTCYAPTNYKVSGSSYFYLGKSGAYIELPSFSNPIEKIVVTGNSGASTAVIWNIFKGDDAVSTAATGSAEDSYTFNIAEPEANVVYTLKVTSAHNLQIKAIKIFFGTAPAVAKPTISGDENFVGSTTVTITHADADAIYYTTDGSDPKTSGTKQTYSVPFTVNADGTTTVKAYAVKGSDVSAVASKEFTKVSALESLAALLEATTSTETAFNVVVTNWVVTGVSGTRAWIADAANEKGILLYKSGHNFTAGNKLNGVVIGTKTKLYQGYPEMTTLVSADVTVTTAAAITPRTTTIAALTSGHPAEQGIVVKLENLTYTAASTSLSDGVNTIQADNKLYSASLIDGATYNLTGVVEYLDGSVVKIMPRSADDVEQTSGGGLPEVTGLAALKAEAVGTSYLLTLTDAIVTLVDGNNAFIEDANAGALIYFSGHGLAAGDKLNGQYEVTTATYNGKFEITAMTAQDGAQTTHNAEIPVTTLTIAQLNANFAANESRRIKIVGVNVTDAIGTGDRDGVISDGTNTIILYAGKSGVSATLNDNIDAIGYPTFYVKDATNQQQLAVWAQADITVNQKEAAGIAFTPTSATITAGDAWSAPEFANPNSLTVTFSSDDETVAKVSSAGVVSLEGGYGTAVVTAHTDGDATHSAANATYTITVNDPASVDTRKVAESPEGGFSDISGNLSGNEISFQAYQGGASNAPNGNNTAHELRLYKYQATTEYGGYVTILAKSGCTIDQVVITVSANCNVGYSKNTEELPTKESEPIAVGTSSSFDTGTGLNADSVRVVNLDASNQFKIKTITVYYTGESAALESIAISGTASVLEYTAGDEFDPTGLVVTGTYTDDSEEEITDGITWTFNPATLSEGATSVSVTATVGEITSAAFVVNGLTVSAAPAPSTSTYRKVTATADITDGEYLIVYETTGVAFNGALEALDAEGNSIAVTINEGVIAGTTAIDAAVFTIDVTAGTLQSASGKYIGVSSNSNGLKQTDDASTYTHTFSIDDDGNAVILANFEESTMKLRYNSSTSSGNLRFRYYKNDGQQAVQLYKKESATPPTPVEEWEEVRNSLDIGRHYTACLKKKIVAVKGATIWSLRYRNEAGTAAYLEEVTDLSQMAAGTPFIYQATADKFEVVYEGNDAEAPVESGALRGTFVDMTSSDLEALPNVYLMYQNTLRPIQAGYHNSLQKFRAYVLYDAFQVGTPQSAPGRRVRTMSLQDNVATGIEDTESAAQVVKVMINGQLFIQRGEKLYDVTGQMVK